MTDWASDVDFIQGGLSGFAQRLQLLSLLYDEVVLQDEFMALSDLLAEWFTTRDGVNIWAELLDLGSIVVLKHPKNAFMDDAHRTRSLTAPISARAMHISAYGTKNELPFVPTALHDAFHLQTDACLRLRPSCTREVGTIGPMRDLDIMGAFRQALQSVLMHAENRDWLDVHLGGLPPEAIERFAQYSREPELALAHSRDAGLSTNVLTSASAPVFNRSLAYQTTRLFDSTTAAKLQRLIQSAFAAAFCWREGALGQYGGKVSPIPGPPARKRHNQADALVEVGAEMTVSVAIPSLAPGFSKAVAEVRNSEAGIALRNAVANIGQSASFALQTECWRNVATELAARAPTSRLLPISIHEIGHRALESTAVGVLVHLAGDSLSQSQIGLQTILEGAKYGIAHGAGSLVFDGLRNIAAALGSRGRIAYALERAVAFNCMWIQEPASLANSSEA